MTVRNPSSEGLSALQKLPGVLTVHAVGPKIVFDIAEGQTDARERIVESAVKNGMGVLEFSAEKVSLEEIFLQLTTDEHSEITAGGITAAEGTE